MDAQAVARQAAAELAVRCDAGLLAFAFEAWQDATERAKAERVAATQRSAAEDARLLAAVKRLSRGSVWRVSGVALRRKKHELGIMSACTRARNHK